MTRVRRARARGEVARWRGATGYGLTGAKPSYTWNRITGRGAKLVLLLQEIKAIIHVDLHVGIPTGRGPYLFIGRVHSRGINARAIQRWIHFLPLKKHHYLRSTQAVLPPSELHFVRLPWIYFIFCTNLLAGFLSFPGHCTWQCRSTVRVQK